MASRKQQPKKRTVSKRKKREGLTKAEEAFCQHYALHKVGSEAVRHAWPEWRGKDNQLTAVKASTLLAAAKIKQRLAVLEIKVAAIAEQKFEISAEKVLQELAAVAFSNAETYFEWGYVERPVLRKNRKTGDVVHLRDANDQPMFEAVPFAKMKASEDLTTVQKKAVISVSETVSKTGDRVIDVKMADKMGALKLLTQHLGLLKERVEHTGKDGKPIETVNTNVSLPDLSVVTDPRDALRQFEMFRTQMSGSGKPN